MFLFISSLINRPYAREQLFWATLVFIMLAGSFLRFYDISWDSGFSYTPHPDERAILMKASELKTPKLSEMETLFNAEKSPLNPKWFPYGSFPLYALKTIQYFIEKFTPFEIVDTRILARTISAVADVGSILGIAALGKITFGRKTALLAAVFLSFSVLHIQLSHFFAFDTITTFFAIWIIYFLYQTSVHGKKRYSMGAGALMGLGLASKISLAPIFGVFILAHVIYASNEHKNNFIDISRIKKSINLCLVGLITCLLLFFMAQPYALLDFNVFIKDILEQSEMVRRIRDYPYTRQYIDTTPYIYQILQLGKWGLGWPLLITALAGILWALKKGISYPVFLISLLGIIVLPASILILNNSLSAILASSTLCLVSLYFRYLLGSKISHISVILLSWLIPYMLITGSFDVKFLRYTLPALPVMCLLASAFINGINPRHSKYSKISKVGLIAITLSVTIWYGLSTTGIYQSTHTAVKASQWINNNASEGDVILKEHWEESLPELQKFVQIELPIYEQDTEQKIHAMADHLSNGDYIVLFSNRLYGSVTRLNDRYPFMRAYYKSLFSGTLGYEPVLIKSSYLNFGGIHLVEDTFRNPDLPDPTKALAFDIPVKGINLGFADESFSVYDHPKVLIFENRKNYTADFIVENILAFADLSPHTTFSEDIYSKDQDFQNLMMDPNRKAIQQSGGTWSMIFDDSIGSISASLRWFLFIQLFALSAIGFTFVLFSQFTDRGYLFSKIIGLLLVSFTAWILTTYEVMKFESFTIWVCIFIVTLFSVPIIFYNRNQFVVFIRTRWKHIGILELIFLVSFLIFVFIRMCNPDLWHPYRGGEKPMDIAYLNAVVKSTYMPPYDPWFSGGVLNYYYWGQFVIASIIHITRIPTEIAYNLAIPTLFSLAVAGCFTIGYNLVSQGRKHTVFAYLTGMTAVAFVCVIGNLDGLLQASNLLFEKLSGNTMITSFDFWRSSRMMPPDPPGHEITEFPFFSFLFADLHAHLIAIPFTLLVIGISLSIILANNRRTPPKFQEFLTLTLLGLTIGSLRAINTWDLPTYTILGLVSIGIGEFLRHGGVGLTVFYKTALKAIFVLIVIFAGFVPYQISSETFFNSIERTTNTTSLSQLLSINGLFIFLLSAGAIYLIRNKLLLALSGIKWIARASVTPGVLKLSELILVLIVIGLVGFIITFLLSGVLGGAIPTALLLFLLISYSAVQKPSDETRNLQPIFLFACLLALGGLGLIILVDIWRVEGDIERMNTVFKFYIQSWVMLAISSSYFSYRVLSSFNQLPITAKVSWSLISTILVLGSLIYPVMGSRDRIQDRFAPTPFSLNGYKYIEGTTYNDPVGTINLENDFKGILWLRQNIEGSPVIAEGLTPSYRWGGRVSVHTGLPSVIGWKWHQEQQRWDYRQSVEDRRRDIDMLYSNPSMADEIIDRYGISYIYVGSVENLYYPSEGIKALKEGLEGKLGIVFESKEVTILKVK